MDKNEIARRHSKSFWSLRLSFWIRDQRWVHCKVTWALRVCFETTVDRQKWLDKYENSVRKEGHSQTFFDRSPDIWIIPVEREASLMLALYNSNKNSSNKNSKTILNNNELNELFDDDEQKLFRDGKLTESKVEIASLFQEKITLFILDHDMQEVEVVNIGDQGDHLRGYSYFHFVRIKLCKSFGKDLEARVTTFEFSRRTRVTNPLFLPCIEGQPSVQTLIEFFHCKLKRTAIFHLFIHQLENVFSSCRALQIFAKK